MTDFASFYRRYFVLCKVLDPDMLSTTGLYTLDVEPPKEFLDSLTVRHLTGGQRKKPSVRNLVNPKLPIKCEISSVSNFVG